MCAQPPQDSPWEKLRVRLESARQSGSNKGFRDALAEAVDIFDHADDPIVRWAVFHGLSLKPEDYPTECADLLDRAGQIAGQASDPEYRSRWIQPAIDAYLRSNSPQPSPGGPSPR